MQDLKKERQELENSASKLLTLALKAGADSGEVCATYGQKTKITLEKQDYHLASSDDGYNFGLRVIKGKKQGFACCNTTDPQELKEIALRAVEIAGFSPENPFNQISASPNIPDSAPRDMWDDSLFGISLQTQKEWTKVLIDEATRDARFRLNEGTVAIASGLYLVMNSLGTHKLEKETCASWSLMGMGVEGSNITSFDYFGEISRNAREVPDRMLSSARSFRDRVLWCLKQGPATSYKGLVVFSPRAVVDILLSSISYHFSARSVVEKTGKWRLEDLNKAVCNSQLTIRDMPWLADRAGCASFDREGTPTGNRTVLEHGQLRSFLIDNYAAQALNLTSTGNASGGPNSVPTVAPHTLCIDRGNEPLIQLIKRATDQQKELLLVHRYSGQVDPITGDFSGIAKGAEWWSGGERRYCAQETMISGNLFDALGSSLYGISRETEIVECAEESPTLVVDNVSVTSGK